MGIRDRYKTAASKKYFFIIKLLGSRFILGELIFLIIGRIKLKEAEEFVNLKVY